MVTKFEGVKKRAKVCKSGAKRISEDWLNKLFDICKCKCNISEDVKIFNGKVSCGCQWEDQIPKEEISFLVDQRTERKMILTTHKDLVYSRKKQVSLNKLKRRGDVENLEQPTTSKIYVTVEDDKVLVVPSKLRSFKLVTNYTAIEDDSSDTGEDDMQFEPKEVIGGKGYTRKLVSVSDTSCILADGR